MAKIEVLNVLGKKTSELELSDKVFAIEPHNQAMYDLILSERASLRSGNHQTKTRSDVSGGGRKPWKQKGTGRARQGSIRSPQWKGGGVVFGPNSDKNYELKVNKKIRKLALRSGWSQLLKENRILAIDNIDFQTPSTKDFKIMLDNLGLKNNGILVILSDFLKEKNTYASGRNLKNVSLITNKDILLDTLLKAKKIIIPVFTLKAIERGLLDDEKN